MLRLAELSKAFGNQIILAQVSLQIPTGERVALVGANGAGKTTLLNMICGTEAPDGGHIVTSKQYRIGYLPQKPDPNPEDTILTECLAGAKDLKLLETRMAAALAKSETDPDALLEYEAAETEFRRRSGYALEAKAQGILKGLGFLEVERNPRELSGGWRMRLELAKLFLNQPDFLVLDEPTNHLDLPALVWMEQFLQSFPGTLLFVSHDRALLDRLASYTLHLDRGRMKLYTGNFSAFLDQREADRERDASERGKIERRRQELERFVERFGAKASKARQAQSRMKMIGRLRDLESNFDEPDIEGRTVSINFPVARKGNREVLKIEDGAIGYATVLSKSIQFTVERGQKIAIIGANGLGKSTLLKTIVGEVQPKGGQFLLGEQIDVGYFAQDQRTHLDGSLSMLDHVLKATPLGQGEARGLLGAFLFSGKSVEKKASHLSGGELSRLGMALMLAKKANLLLLDEPTNHLDMASVEALVQALDEYEGTVMFVSHDREFIDGFCTHVFVMTGTTPPMLFEGKLSDYERMCVTTGFPNVLAPQVDAKKSAGPQEKPRTSDFKELKRNLQKAEKTAAAAEKSLGELNTKIEALQKKIEAEADYRKQASLHLEVDQLQNQLGVVENDWLQATESIENLKTQIQGTGRS